MGITESYLVILVAAVALVPFLKVKWKGVITVSALVVNAGVSAFPAILALAGDPVEFVFSGTLVTGEIPVRIDALSGWFILVINFTMITGGLYGLQYMKAYREQSSGISLHCIAFLGVQSALTAICAVQNTLVFLLIWEIMALSAFILVIFEHYKPETLQAGINYLIQSHVSIVFLTVGFIWMASRTGSYDFKAIAGYSATFSSAAGLALFLCFFAGFALKAGFVPFHTWLPYAHPAAPSHVSGVMSGVIIKIGIYGILRMILLIKMDYILSGSIMLVVSVISGIYGVMLATLQHNLKKLLAYHSIENIGIIGIGIGLGTIGLGTGNVLLITLGFAGGLLHVLNHSLFKSLLFYGAGNVYQAVHTLNIERLGGLVKEMPHTSALFLAAALAICGLPPFNGFVSEFLIYSGLFAGFNGAGAGSVLFILFSVFSLALTGGLAMLCFTKAFGSVFLGNARSPYPGPVVEANTWTRAPMYLIVGLMISIGLFPGFFFGLQSEPLGLFTGLLADSAVLQPVGATVQTLQKAGWAAMGFLVLSAAVWWIRKKITAQNPVSWSPTWGCGYTGETARMQYTASSFVRSYRKLAEPLLSIRKIKKEVKNIFPTDGRHETHPYDKAEEWLIDYPLKKIHSFFQKFRFLQNGNPRYYILYGFAFITLVMGIPFLYEAFRSLIQFLNQL